MTNAVRSKPRINLDAIPRMVSQDVIRRLQYATSLRMMNLIHALWDYLSYFSALMQDNNHDVSLAEQIDKKNEEKKGTKWDIF